MATEKTLNDAFYETLKDVYYAEKQAVKACKKSAKAAKAPELKKAFEQHGVESEGHVERLQQVFEIIGKTARAKTCEAMQGITAEMEEDLEAFGDTEAGDAVLIGCGQAVEHYEIARYGMLKAWALAAWHGRCRKAFGCHAPGREKGRCPSQSNRRKERQPKRSRHEGKGSVKIIEARQQKAERNAFPPFSINS